MKNPLNLRFVSALCATILLATSAQATVTNVAWYRLGENDPGAAPGTAVSTKDIAGNRTMTLVNGPAYDSDVAAAAVTHTGSSYSLHFAGSSNAWGTNVLLSTAVNNFGLELWVKPATSAGTHIIAYNGNTATSGWGFYQNGASYVVLFGGVSLFASGTATANVWTHLALVRDNGTTTLYVNGAAAGTSGLAPNFPTGLFGLAAPPNSPVAELFDGWIDEVRMFTFAPGQFTTNDLLLNAAPPVASTSAATNVGPNSATLTGSANPHGFAMAAWFEWGTTTNYGNLTPTTNIGSGITSSNLTQAITGLTAGVTYYFRAAASNILGLTFGSSQSFSVPVFVNINAGLTGVYNASAAWGDYDNDGLLDVLMIGYDTNFIPLTQIWRNTGNGFTNVTSVVAPGLRASGYGSVAWGDYDNDGRLDFLITGTTNQLGAAEISEIWHNTGNGFSNVTSHVAPGLPGVFYSSMAWGDYDNDGGLDFLITGVAGNSPIAQIWHNTGNGFTNATATLAPDLPGVYWSSVAWGDYDNDGRLDFLITGTTNNGGSISQIWHNTGNGFTNATSTLAPDLPGVYYSSVAWGDYDNDGRLDFLLAGQPTSLRVSQVWRNTGSGFTNVTSAVAPGLPGTYYSSVAWGDYDNDGRLDFLISGAIGGAGISQVWHNTGNGFANVTSVVIPDLPGIFLGSVSWGDYDNDGRLDFLITGAVGSGFSTLAQVRRNYIQPTNTPPAAPAGLTTNFTNAVATLSWNAGSDAQTPTATLNYNLRIGTTPGGSDVLAPMAGASGLRRLPAMGNRQQVLTFPFQSFTIGQPYYWSVQAVDTAFAGSSFASEATFKILQASPVLVPVTTTNLAPGDLNGDGVVSQSELAVVLANLNGNGIINQSELDLVLSNYWANTPMQMTNLTGLGQANVTFALTNSAATLFTVEYSSNLVNWLPLGPALPRYLFTDTNAPAPQRYYRLRQP